MVYLPTFTMKIHQMWTEPKRCFKHARFRLTACGAAKDFVQ